MTSPYVYSNNKTSARKILFSLMSPPYQSDTIKKSNIAIDEPVLKRNTKKKEYEESVNMPIQLEILNFETYENKLDKIEKMIHENKKQIKEFEILIQDRQKTQNCRYKEQQKNEFYNMLKKWLMKQVSICINGFDIQGVLTEITSECLTLVVSESIYIIPLKRIDFVKLNV